MSKKEEENFKFLRKLILENKTYKNLSQLANLCCGTSTIDQEVRTFIYDNNLENTWKIFAKLLIKDTQLSSPTLGRLSDECFDISTSESFDIFKNSYSNNTSSSSNPDKRSKKIIKSIEDLSEKKLSNELIENIKKFCSYKKEYNPDKDKLSILCIKEIQTLKNKNTNNLIPITTAYQLLDINNQYYKKHLKGELL